MLVKLTQDLKNGFGPWKEMLLAGFVGKAIAPNAIGQPYIKER